MAKRCEWAGDERRRKAEHGGVGTPHSRGATGMVIGSGVRCGRGGLVFLLALARSAARRLGDSAAWRLVGSLAQWERPRNRSHVAARDRTIKPSWGAGVLAGRCEFRPFVTGRFPSRHEIRDIFRWIRVRHNTGWHVMCGAQRPQDGGRSGDPGYRPRALCPRAGQTPGARRPL